MARLAFFAAVLALAAQAQPAWPPDARHRHVIPHGFVTVTGDSAGEFHYSAADYRRMLALGANFQVIRLFAGQAGAWPGYRLHPAYLRQLDEMVALGKQVGIASAFKMTVYDIHGAGGDPILPANTFGPQDWTDLWQNKGGRQDAMVEAWRRIFEHFKNEPAVVGYDVLNEASPGTMQVSHPEFLARYMLPYYRRVIDVLHQIDPQQWALYQPTIGAQPMNVSLERDRLVFAPHLYADMREYLASRGTPDPSKYRPALERFQAEAAASRAVLFVGEFGNPSLLDNEANLERHMAQAAGERAAAAEFDRMALGSCRPWYTGTRKPIPIAGLLVTWGMFLGDSEAGGPERTWITDIFARPFPLVTAGVVKTFGFDFATRTFQMKFDADPAKGESEIYIPLRHYPDGFRVVLPDGSKIAPQTDGSAPCKWDAARSRIVVSAWPSAISNATLKIIPGTRD